MKECIQGLWIGKSLSLMEQLSIKSFLANGHEYHLYTYGKVKNIPEGTIVKDGNEILPKQKIFKHNIGQEKGSYAGFSELFRWKLLLDKGGIWSDLDVVCLKPFDFNKKYVFSSEKSPSGKTKITTCIIKVPIKNQLIKSCYEFAKKRDPQTVRFAEMGPKLIDSQVREFKLNSFVLPPNAFCPINYWDFDKFIDPNFKFKIPKETYAIHLWNEKWRRGDKTEGEILKAIYRTSAKLKKYSLFYSRFIDFIKDFNSSFLELFIENKSLVRPKYDKNRVYGPETLYGQLQRRYL